MGVCSIAIEAKIIMVVSRVAFAIFLNICFLFSPLGFFEASKKLRIKGGACSSLITLAQLS